jgi:hypothetical protein
MSCRRGACSMRPFRRTNGSVSAGLGTTLMPTITLTTMVNRTSGKSSIDGDAFFKVYEEYSKTLRTWLVAFGVGGPVLFLTNQAIAAKLAGSGYSAWIAGLFLVGVALQVTLAMLNKHAMWACHIAASKPHDEHTRFEQWGEWISDQYWIDVIVDVLSLLVFSIAAIWAFRVLLAAG